MSKPTKTVRFGDQFVRLSINPVLFEKVRESGVDWKGVVERARKKYPKISLSWAVEGILMELPVKAIRELPIAAPTGVSGPLPMELQRFVVLLPGEKIRQMLRWKNTLQKLRGLT